MKDHVNMTTNIPDPHKEVFVSYGRKDAADFTNALCARLEKEHFKVWRDINKINYGDRWKEVIVKGIGSSEVVIAILSSWAMRNPRSPCNEELQTAHESGRSIVPVRINDCSVPFGLKTRHHIEMQNWDLDKQLTAGIDIVMHVIRTNDYPRNELTDLKHILKPSDPSDEIDRLVTSFIGRESVMGAIEEQVERSGVKVILVEGDPGIGKSAIWANLVKRGIAQAWYRCKNGDQERATPELFVRTVAFHLAVDRSWYRKAILAIQDLPDSINDLKTRLLVLPFRDYSENTSTIIAVDALDEGRNAQGIIPIAEHIRDLAQDLPGNVRFVITCRPDPEIRAKMPSPFVINLKLDSPENIEDIDRYLAFRSNGTRFRQQVQDPKAMTAAIRKRAQGNFLYAVSMMNAIEAGHLDPTELPADMNAYFQLQLERAFADRAAFDRASPILEVLCAALRPLGPDAVAAILDIDPVDVTRVITALPDLFRIENGSYVPFHTTLIDWLARKEAHAFSISSRKGHRSIIAYCQRHLESGRIPKHYHLALLPEHLMAIGDDEGLGRLLTDQRMLDHLDLADPNRARAMYAYAFGTSDREANSAMIERMHALLNTDGTDAPREVRCARMLKVARLLDKLEAFEKSRPLYATLISGMNDGVEIPGTDPGELHMNLAIALRNLAEYDASEREFTLAGEWISSNHGEDGQRHGLWCYRHATLLWQAGKQDEQKKKDMWARSNALYRKAADLLKDAPDPQLIPELLNDHSVLLDNMGDHEASVRACEEGLKLLDRTGTETGTVAAELHFNLAAHRHGLYMANFTRSLQVINPLKDIRDHYTRSHDLFSSVLGADHERPAAVLKSIARLDDLLERVKKLQGIVDGDQAELARYCAHPENMAHHVLALLMPADLGRSFLSEFARTKEGFFLRSLIDLQCAVLHFRNKNAAAMMARMDPLIGFWRKLEAKGILSQLLTYHYFMLDQLAAHDRAKDVLQELIDLIYTGDKPDGDPAMLLVYLGYLRSHDTARASIAVIDRIQSGKLYPQFRSLPTLTRLKATILYSLGDFNAAAEQQALYLEALNSTEPATDDLTLIYSIVSVGLYQKSAGQFDRAMEQYQAALNMAVKRRTEDIELQAHIRGNMASLLRDRGELLPAIEEMNFVVATVRNAKGGDHESCAVELLKRASILLPAGQYPQARNDLGQAIKTIDDRHAPEAIHWNRARGLELLAILQHIEGDAAGSDLTFARAMEHYNACHTSLRPIEREKIEVGISHGRMRHDHGLPDAIGLFAQARSSAGNLLGEKHYLSMLADAWMQLAGTDDEALDGIEQQLMALEQDMGATHPLSLEIRLELALRKSNAAGVKELIGKLTAHECPITHLKAKAHMGLARLLYQAGQVLEADMACDRAIELFDAIKPGHALATSCRRMKHDQAPGIAR